MTRRTARTILASLIGFGALLVAAGCHVTPITPKDRTPAVSKPLATVKDSLADVSTEHGAARRDIATVVTAPTLPPSLLPPLKSADQHVAKADEFTRAATTQVAAAEHAVEAWGKADLETQQKLHDAQVRIAKLESQFWSPRQIRDFWIFVITGGLLALAFGLTKQAAMFSPALRIVRWIGMGIASCGLTVVHDMGHVFALAVDKVHAWWTKRKAAKAAAVAVTPKPAAV